MTDEDVLQEIRQVREKIARECDYDVRKIGEWIRRREREKMKRGARYVSVPETASVREETK